MIKKRIIVICTGNSCRSQMAHGYLEKFSKGRVKVFSAGTKKYELNPNAVKSMKFDGIDISHYTSNSIDEYQNETFDFVITVCDNAKETCPVFNSQSKVFHKSFTDPVKFNGTDKEVMEHFNEIRNEIKQYIKSFVNSYIFNE